MTLKIISKITILSFSWIGNSDANKKRLVMQVEIFIGISFQIFIYKMKKGAVNFN